jgi:hypothetical protein
LTTEALVEDMRFEFSLLPHWAKIARMAVVTEFQASAALLRWVDHDLQSRRHRASGTLRRGGRA